MLVADLLAPSGSHGQGSLFLSEFLSAVGVDRRLAMDRVTVSPEKMLRLKGEDIGRIDVLVDFGDREFGLAIESKPWAYEQEAQLERYVKGLSELYGQNFILLFLTKEGREPATLVPETRRALEPAGRFKVIYFGRELRNWAEACRFKSEAPRLKDTFASLRAFIDQHIEEGASMADEGEAGFVAECVLESPEMFKLGSQVAEGVRVAQGKIINSFARELERRLRESVPADWAFDNQLSYWEPTAGTAELRMRREGWPPTYHVILQVYGGMRHVFVCLVKQQQDVTWLDGKSEDVVKAYLDNRCGRGQINPWGWWKGCDPPYANWATPEAFMRLKWESDAALDYYSKNILGVKDAALDLFPTLNG
jgi:hypothetical protein